MSTDILNIQVSHTPTTEAVGWNRIWTGDSFPVTLDDEDGTVSTLTIDVNTVPSGSQINGDAGTDKHGIPELVLEAAWRAGTGVVAQLEIGGTLPTGKRIKQISLLGSTSQATSDRIGDYTVGGVTLAHDAKGYGDAVPVVFTTGLTLPLTIDWEKGAGASNAYLSSIQIELESAAETVVSASIPLTVQAGWTNLPLVSPLTTSGYMLEGFTGDTPVTGDTMEYETTTDLSPDAASQWIWDTAPTVTQVVARRVIQIDGTVGATADITFTVVGPTPLPNDRVSYAMRQMARRVLFHSSLIVVEKGKQEQVLMNAAQVALGGASLTAPVDGITPDAGYTGTQTIDEFNKRVQKASVTANALDVAEVIRIALINTGWTA